MKSFKEFLTENKERNLDDFKGSWDVIKGETAEKFLETLQEFFDILGWKFEITNTQNSIYIKFFTKDFYVHVEFHGKSRVSLRGEDSVWLEIDLPTNKKIGDVSQHEVYRKTFIDEKKYPSLQKKSRFELAANYLNTSFLTAGLTREYYDIKNNPERRGELLSKKSGII